MDTKLLELRLVVKCLPSTSKTVQLSVKSEILRLAELLMLQDEKKGELK